MTSTKFLRPDRSAKTGLLVGAVAIGTSFQPGLLTRATKDQAIITVASGLAGYVAATAGSAALESFKRRFPSRAKPLVDGLLVAAGVAAVYANRPKEHEGNVRALTRLAGIGCATIGSATVVTNSISRVQESRSTLTQFAIAKTTSLVLAAGTYLALKPQDQRVGSLDADGSFEEDTDRNVNPTEALGIAAAATGVLIAVAHFESYTVREISRGLTKVVGGAPEDHRALARIGSIAANALVARMVMSKLSAVMTKAGKSMELAHFEPPTLTEVTGCEESGANWRTLSREGRRWLSMVLQAGKIAGVMGEDARQPIRVYASIDSGVDDQSRATYLLSELERTNAYERSVLALFSPTGSGYINYVATETLEYLTRGNCASAGIEYSVLPSSMSLTAVPLGARQTRLVIDGIVEKLLTIPAESRPRFVLFGESLGAQVSQDTFTGQGLEGLKAAGIEAAIWIGTPNATKWRKELWGERSVFEPPQLGPGSAYLPRTASEWLDQSIEEQEAVQYLLLQNGDDPVPKFGSQLFWQEPPWLYRDHQRPPGSPEGTRWIPFVTAIQTFVDLINALSPTPGTFMDGGHDYRIAIPPSVRAVFHLQASDDQNEAISLALREREFGWELARRWLEAGSISDQAKRTKKSDKVRQDATSWIGRDPKTELLSEVEVDALLRSNWW